MKIHRLACVWGALVLAAYAQAKEPRQTEDEGRAQLAAFAKTYSTCQEWQARAANIRAGFLREAHLSPWPARCDLKPIVRGRQVRQGYTVESFAIEALPGFFMTGNLYRPANAKGPLAAILCPHGHATDDTAGVADPRARGGRFLAYTQTRAATLARMGAIAATYDMIGWGECNQVVHEDPNVLSLQLWGNVRVLDFLLTLADVDPKRIGITGESGGGTQSFFLAALDDRIAVTVPCVQVSAHFFGGCPCESGLPVHKSATHDTSNVELAAMAAPRPQLIISDAKDWTHNVPGVEFPYVWNVYRLYGATDQVENAHFADEGHDYGPSKRLAAYKFLARHLGLNLKAVLKPCGCVDESGTVVEEKESLCVFTPRHPRPDYALKGSAAAVEALDRAVRSAGR
jgi:dienelactone hydrolase